jgi:hypothetical protein
MALAPEHGKDPEHGFVVKDANGMALSHVRERR